MTLRTRFLAVTWGFLWAAFLEFTQAGRWMVKRRTWQSVVIGVGVDLLILRRLLPRAQWWWVVEIISLSAIGILLRSWLLEHREDTNGIQ